MTSKLLKCLVISWLNLRSASIWMKASLSSPVSLRRRAMRAALSQDLQALPCVGFDAMKLREIIACPLGQWLLRELMVPIPPPLRTFSALVTASMCSGLAHARLRHRWSITNSGSGSPKVLTNITRCTR